MTAEPDAATLVGANLEGKACWYVSCGGVGTTFQLALGDRVAREQPLSNPAHTDEYRQYEGEANLLVWCTWRLDGPAGPLSSSDDTQEAVKAALHGLVGRLAEKVIVDLPSWDLHLGFSGDKTLHVFCDHVGQAPSLDTNWELWAVDKVVFVLAGSIAEVEDRGGAA